MPDTRRERDRYRRESLVEQAHDELLDLWHHPKVMLLLALILGGWLVLRVLEPPVVQLEALHAGDCLYIPTPASGGPDAIRPIGSDAEAAAGLVLAGAERAPCDGSHGHEVAGVFTLVEPAGAPYPGMSALVGREQVACEAAFTGYVGRPVVGSRYDLTIVVPTDAAWAKNRRAGACLVSNSDGTFMSRRAAGSGG